MKSQPNRDYISNDDVQTPAWLAEAIVEHFQPSGIVLEPCRGDGAFIAALENYGARNRALKQIKWCEIKEGRDFLNGDTPKADWIVSNPPWSLIRSFLQRSMIVANDIVFLITVNHAWTKARVRDVKEMGFGMKGIALCQMPKEFPQSGFQLGAVHWSRGYGGSIDLVELYEPCRPMPVHHGRFVATA